MNEENINEMKGYVVSIDDITSDVRIVKISCDHNVKIAFQAGQYALLTFETCEERPYSIASMPDDVLEFHIKNTGYGVSSHTEKNLKLGDPVRVRAPLGDGYLRQSDRPILTIASGLGIAPIKSIVDTVLKHHALTPVHLYYGEKSLKDLYLEKHFIEQSQKYKSLSFVPVLTREEGLSAQYRTGYVAKAAIEDIGDVSGYDIYISGPLDMVKDSVLLLLDHGASLDNIYSDALAALKLTDRKTL